MKEVYSRKGGVTKTIARDAHDPTKVYHHTHTDERETLANNERIRSEGLLKQGSKSKFAAGDDIAYAFQFPTVTDYRMAKQLEPELFATVETGTDTERYAAAFKLSLIFPGYVTTTRRGDAPRR